VTAFQYDPNGNLLSITDARNINNPTTYAYDNMDRLQTRTDPLGNIETYSYDANGNLTCLTDRRGKDTVFQYDVLDRPIFAGLGRSTCSSGAYENRDIENINGYFQRLQCLTTNNTPCCWAITK